MKFDIMSAIKDEIPKMEEDSKESAFDNVFLDYVERSIYDVTMCEFPEFYELKLSEVLPIDKRNELKLVLINKFGDNYHMIINANGYSVTNDPSNINITVTASNFSVCEEFSTQYLAFTYINDIVVVKKTIDHTIEIQVYQNAAKEYDGNVNVISTIPYLVPNNRHFIESEKSGKAYVYEKSQSAGADEHTISGDKRYTLAYLRSLGIYYCSHCKREDDFNKYKIFKKSN